MLLKKCLEKLRRIDNLIAKKSTGCQKELAKKIGVSVSTLNNYLNIMRETGFPIRYSLERKTYYYEHEGHMVDSFFTASLSKEEMKKKTGGLSVAYLKLTFSY